MIAISQATINEDRPKNLINRFFYTDLFPLFVGLIAFISWANNLTLIGLGVFVFIACYIFVSQEDMTPIIPLLFCVIMLFRSLATASKTATFIILAPAVLCVLIHVFKYRYTPNLGKLFFPLIGVTIALFIGGINSYYVSDYLRGLPTMISIGPGLIIVYLFFLNYIRPPKGVNLKTYLCKCVILMTLFACFEAAFSLYNYKILKNTLFVPYELGWSNINNVGTLILLSVPLCFYLLVKTKKIVPYFMLSMVFLGYAFMINSSAALFFLVLSLPVLFIYSYLKLPKQKRLILRNCIFSFVAIATAIIFIVLATNFAAMERYIEVLMSYSGRESLYNKAVELIKEHPILGVGFGYHNAGSSMDFKFENLRIYNFHCTFLQVLASMGIVGMFAYVFYYIQRIRIFTEKDTRFSKFAFISFLLFSFHGIFDTCEFNMIPLLIVLTLILVVVEVESYKPKKPSFYPPIIF